MNILSVSDKKYLKYLMTFLKSLEKNTSCIDVVFLYLINLTNDDLKMLNNIKLNIQYENIQCSYNNTRNKLTRYSCGTLNGRYMSDMHAYCNNIRYIIIPHLLKKYNKPLLYIDVDNIVLKDLDELKNNILNNDICIYKYPIHLHPVTWRKFMTFACGIIGINTTKNSINFFESLKQEVILNGILTVGDQLDFYNTWLKYKDSIKLHKLNKKFKDHELNNDSVIWSGDGNVKDIQRKYQLEMEKYK